MNDSKYTDLLIMLALVPIVLMWELTKATVRGVRSFVTDVSWRVRVSFWHVWGAMTHTHIVGEFGPTVGDPYGMKKTCLRCSKDFGPIDLTETGCVPGEPDPDGIGGRKPLWGGR